MYGAEAEVEFKDFAAPLINDVQAVKEVTAVTEQLICREQIVSDYEKALGADDFADYLAVTRGMYAFVGTHSEKKPGSGVAHHHGLFDLDVKVKGDLQVDDHHTIEDTGIASLILQRVRGLRLVGDGGRGNLTFCKNKI